MAVEAGSSPAKAPEESGGRGRTLRFILVFVVAVLSLLTGYRYAINTQLNDWYLFQVARHTSWVLDKVGYSSELETVIRAGGPAAEKRATLNAWRKGRREAKPEEIAATSDAPLTPWERWSYRAFQTRLDGQQGVHGPKVSFVLTPGIDQKIRQAYAQIESLDTDSSLSAAERETRRKELQDNVDALQTRYQEIRESRQSGRHPERGKFFDFYVISECGAIEVMAIFFAAIIAFPALWWKRVIGLVFGLPVMYAVNIFRLSCLGIIGALTAGGKIFHFSHHYVWQAIYIVFVVVVWLAWLEFLVNRDTRMPSLLRELFASHTRIRRLAAFGLRFIIIITGCALLWWWLIPVYGRVLLVICTWLFHWAVRMPVEGGRIDPMGLFNTETRLVFYMQGREPALPIALLVTNIPPYIALVLATAGLRLWRRLRILCYGSAILMVGHVAFIVVVLRYQEALQRASEIPVAIIQFFLTLPFLLWIVFAYWEQLMRFRTVQDGGPAATAAAVSDDGQAHHAPVSPGCVLPGEPIHCHEDEQLSGDE